MTPRRMLHLLVVAPLLTSPVFGGGCASTTLELTSNHPGRPDASPGATEDPAAILLTSPGLDRQVLMAGSGLARAQPADDIRGNVFVGRGIIRSFAEGAIAIQHDAIPGLMGAMTMSYAIAEGVDIATLEVGDSVTFQIEQTEFAGFRIVNVEASNPEQVRQEEAHDHSVPESAPPTASQPREE